MNEKTFDEEIWNLLYKAQAWYKAQVAASKAQVDANLEQIEALLHTFLHGKGAETFDQGISNYTSD